jgi:predicted transcriptional regulator
MQHVNNKIDMIKNNKGNGKVNTGRLTEVESKDVLYQNVNIFLSNLKNNEGSLHRSELTIFYKMSDKLLDDVVDFCKRKELITIEEKAGIYYELTSLGHSIFENYKGKIENYFSEISKIEKAENTKKINDAKLSTWQVRTFWPLFFLSIFGGCYSAYTFGERLLKEPQDKAISKEISKQLNFKLDSIAQYQKQIETNKLVNQKQDKQDAEISKK